MKTLPRAARDGSGRAVAGKLLDLLAASLTDGEGEQAHRPLLATGDASCRAAGFEPYPYPSGGCDRRFWAILRPVGYPKGPRGRPETASEPRRRLRHVQSGPDTRSPASEIRFPIGHEPTPPLEQIRAPVRSFDLVPNHRRPRAACGDVGPWACPEGVWRVKSLRYPSPNRNRDGVGLQGTDLVSRDRTYHT